MVKEIKRDVVIRGSLFFTKSVFQIESLKCLGVKPIQIIDGHFARYKVDAALIANLNAIANNTRYIWAGPNND